MSYSDPTVQRAYVRRWRADRRAAWLSDKKCAICGSKERLEVDHIDPKSKVDHKVWTWSEPRREAELAKCQVLCYEHHKAKTARELSTPLIHGTNSAYRYRGCRCPDCRRAATEHTRAYRARTGRR